MDCAGRAERRRRFRAQERRWKLGTCFARESGVAFHTPPHSGPGKDDWHKVFETVIFLPMSVTGKVKNGVVVLPPGTHLPVGAEVKVETIELTAANDAFVAAAERLAKPRPHLPKDYALNHG